MAPPTILTPEVQTRICALVNGGAPIPLACKSAGISWNTVKDWLKKGREGIEPYAAFNTACQQAKASWACAAVLRVTKAGAKDWKASAWLLERRVKEFSPPARLELTGKNGGAIQVQAMPTREQALAELRELAKGDPEVARLLRESGES